MRDQVAPPGGGFWADADVEQALKRFRTLVDVVDDGVYQLDAAGRFVAVNDAIVELTGYERAELLDEHASLVTADEDVGRIRREIGARPGKGATFAFTLPAATERSVRVDLAGMLRSREAGDRWRRPGGPAAR